MFLEAPYSAIHCHDGYNHRHCHIVKLSETISSFIEESEGSFKEIIHDTHLNRDQIESNLRVPVPGIQRLLENALFKSFEMSPHLISLSFS